MPDGTGNDSTESMMRTVVRRRRTAQIRLASGWSILLHLLLLGTVSVLVIISVRPDPPASHSAVEGLPPVQVSVEVPAAAILLPADPTPADPAPARTARPVPVEGYWPGIVPGEQVAEVLHLED